MGLKSILVTGLLLLACATARVVAAPFVNLDFEQATVPPGTMDFISTANGFPEWTVRHGSTVLTTVNYNQAGLGGPFAALYDQRDDNLGIPVLQGLYVAIMGGGPLSFGQVGDIPANAKSVRFLSEGHRPPPDVTVNGVLIPVVRLSRTSTILDDIDTYGGDITLFAGTTSDVRFHRPFAGGITSLNRSARISNIQ